MANPANLTNDLCLRCGLCCDGTLFRAVELQPGDDSVRLKNLGLRIRPASRRLGHDMETFTPHARNPAHQFSQPCSALGAGCRCRIYPDRPTYCRQFECLLFQQVRKGRQTTREALRFIRSARRRAALVRRLLLQLGDHDTHEPVGLRFRRLRKRMESTTPGLASGLEPAIDPGAAQDLFQQLSLAVHRLNLLLGGQFYPDPR